MPETAITHPEGVKRLDRHEREDNRADYTLPEPPTLPRAHGIEDLIAWRWGVSTVDEWKNSVSDLMKDREKPQRNPNMIAVGVYRYYASDAYVIEPHQIDDAWGWGLKWRWPETDQIEVIKEAPPWRNVDKNTEIMLLIAAAKRAERAGGVSAQEARPSERAHIPEKYHERIIEAVRAAPFGVQAIQVAKYELQSFQPKIRRSTVAKWLADDAHAGLIKGVQAEGRPTILRPTEGNGDE